MSPNINVVDLKETYYNIINNGYHELINLVYVPYKESMESLVQWVHIVLIELRYAKENQVISTDVVVDTISNNSSIIINYSFFDNIPAFKHLAMVVFGVRIITNQ